MSLVAVLVPLALLADAPLPAPTGWPVPPGNPTPPGPAYTPPVTDAAPAEGAPRIFELTSSAGPDQTFFATGENLTDDLYCWGPGEAPGGQAWKLKVQLATPSYVAATLPQPMADGPVLIWARNAKGASRPVRLNVPEPWLARPWHGEQPARWTVYGRDLARRPDRSAAFAWLSDGRAGRWVEARPEGTHGVGLDLGEVAPGTYQLWLHAGRGGAAGWGTPLALTVTPPPPFPAKTTREVTPADAPRLQALLDSLPPNSNVSLGNGIYRLRATLRIPAGVTLIAHDAGDATLELDHDAGVAFARTSRGEWNQAPGRIHSAGDTMTYRLDVPADGTYAVWLRYATEMSPWNQPGVSGKMSLKVDDGTPVPLQNLPNTGSFGSFKWSRSAELKLTKGQHRLTWRNDQGGGISLDAFAFSAEPGFQPSDQPFPVTGGRTVVLQGEEVETFETHEGELPNASRAVVWLSGDGAALWNTRIVGNPMASTGVLVQSLDPVGWLHGCEVVAVQVTGLEGGGETRGIHLVRAADTLVQANRLTAACPLYLSGVRRSNLSENTLISVTRVGGNSEAAIQGRNETVEECVIIDNVADLPPGAAAGGPTARRLIWLSTGRGSITRNYLAGNRSTAQPTVPLSAPPRPLQYGGVAGTDQNVGEMILFEGNHRTMYFGPLAGADEASVSLPETLPATPDNRLGSVKREELAHDAQGRETPFWPPDTLTTGPEPPIGEYYVTVMAGVGWGQTRRVVRREATKLVLDRPWRVAPTAGSVVTVGTAFYQNLIVNNTCTDGMTGIQLWISCIENLVANNTLARQRRPAFYLYGNGTTLASSMPRTWNRGISPLFWNLVEGNRGEECSEGVLVTNGDDGKMPIEFARALGNVIRHNTFVRSRHNGVLMTSRPQNPAIGDRSPSILGTIVEFNVVRDQETGYHVANSADGAVLRRNHAYFWYPVSRSTDPSVGFDIAPGTTQVAVELNNVEGTVGENNPPGVIPVRRPDAKAPEGSQ